LPNAFNTVSGLARFMKLLIKGALAMCRFDTEQNCFCLAFATCWKFEIPWNDTSLFSKFTTMDGLFNHIFENMVTALHLETNTPRISSVLNYGERFLGKRSSAR
jgi:hypothetical protein